MILATDRRSWIRSVAVPITAGLLVGGAWLTVSFFLLSRVRSADSIRSLADRVRIDLLECRRREKDFLLRSLEESDLYSQGTTSILQLHRESLNHLSHDSEEFVRLVPADWPADLKALLAKQKEYDESFGALVACYRRLGNREFGLEGALRVGAQELERAIDATGDTTLQRDLLQLRCDEKEYLLHGGEGSLLSVRRRSDRLRESIRRAIPGPAPGLQERLDRYLKDLAAYHAVEQEIGLNENQGLQGTMRRAAHEIEPIVTGVVERTTAEYRTATERLRVGLLIATVLLSALLATTFFLTQSARVRSRHLTETTADLTRSNAELQQFAYVASHDLQEPLRAVAGCVQLLQQRYQGKLDEKSNELIRHSVEGCLRMQTLIEDLLTLSRIGRRAQPLVPVDTGRVLQAALENLAIPLKESGATVTHDALPTIPMDPTQMLQVFQNLIGNAIKFRSPKAPVIHVGARREARGWLFSVRDNGIGIEPQYFERIFRVFQRLHTRDEYPGSGIGLAVCEKIVLSQGGRIWLESELNRGTTFFFTLPDRGDAV